MTYEFETSGSFSNYFVDAQNIAQSKRGEFEGYIINFLMRIKKIIYIWFKIFYEHD